ncbi:hypothetical protein HaLaN_29826, partial [Haematococcus lacustris]
MSLSGCSVDVAHEACYTHQHHVVVMAFAPQIQLVLMNGDAPTGPICPADDFSSAAAMAEALPTVAEFSKVTMDFQPWTVVDHQAFAADVLECEHDLHFWQTYTATTKLAVVSFGTPTFPAFTHLVTLTIYGLQKNPTPDEVEIAKHTRVAACIAAEQAAGGLASPLHPPEDPPAAPPAAETVAELDGADEDRELAEARAAADIAMQGVEATPPKLRHERLAQHSLRRQLAAKRKKQARLLPVVRQVTMVRCGRQEACGCKGLATPSTSKAKRLGRGRAPKPEKKADATSDVLERTVTSQLKTWTNEIVRSTWMRCHDLSKACAWPLLQCMRAKDVQTVAMQCACRSVSTLKDTRHRMTSWTAEVKKETQTWATTLGAFYKEHGSTGVLTEWKDLLVQVDSMESTGRELLTRLHKLGLACT